MAGALNRPGGWAAAAECHLPNVLVGTLIRRSHVPARLAGIALGIPFSDSVPPPLSLSWTAFVTCQGGDVESDFSSHP